MRSQSETAALDFRRNGLAEWGTPFEWEEFHYEAELAPEMRFASPSNPFSEAEALELVGELFEIEDKEELDLFLGKLVKKVGRAASGAVRAVKKAVRSLPLGKIANLALNMARGNLVGVLLPLLPASMQKTVRALTSDPFTRFALQATKAALRGDNILRAVQVAAKSGIGDLRERMRFAAMVAPLVPGIGSGVAAALGAASALAAGEPISKALIAAARSAVPGGAIAQAAFDLGSNLAQGKSLSEAALATARNQIPGGPAARAAFDAAVAIGQGKKIQDAAFAAAGRVLPKSPFAADALSFARRVAAGENIGKAALSTAGNAVVKRLERQGVNLLGKAQRQVPGLATLRREVPTGLELPGFLLAEWGPRFEWQELGGGSTGRSGSTTAQASLASLNSFSRQFVRDFIASKRTIDCADLAIELWIRFGEQHQLPVTFTIWISNERRYRRFGRRLFRSTEAFIRYVQSNLGARGLIRNTVEVPGGHRAAVAGDVFLWQYFHNQTNRIHRWGHTQIIDWVRRGTGGPGTDIIRVAQGSLPPIVPVFRDQPASYFYNPRLAQMTVGGHQEPHTGRLVGNGPRRFVGFQHLT